MMRKKLKTAVACALTLLLCMSLTPGASANDPESYPYLGVDGPETVRADAVTKLTAGTDLNLSGGVYIVDSDVEINNLVVTEGSVNLILVDGCTLTVTQDVTVGSVGEGLLTVFCQSGGTGALSASNIEAANGNIFINGGVIAASGRIAADPDSNSKVHIRWAASANSITAASFGSNVEFEDPFVADGTNDPALTSNPSASAGKTLVPAYRVTFDAGDSISGTMDDAYVPASNPSYPLPACTFTPPDSMTFDHWERLTDANSTPVSGTVTLTDRNTTFIAKYKTLQPEAVPVSWSLENSVLTITGSGSMADYAKGGAPWFARRAEITSVVIGPGIDHIGAYAFYACGAIRSVSIQGSGVSVGDRAFSYCAGLSSVELGGASVSSLGEGAFYACFKLSDRSFAGGAQVGNKAFEFCGLGG